MMLEAVWFKDGKEVFCVSPVMNIVCFEEMGDFTDIEINNGYSWYSCEDFDSDVDNFVIRIKKD